MSIKNIIFDLDGTLIDSSSSILASFNEAFQSQGLRPVLPLTADIIGPPLGQTLDQLLGYVNPTLRAKLTDAFKRHYDEVSHQKTTVFDGVEILLRELAAKDVVMYVATNKRIYPTRLIVQHLGWDAWFAGVYSPDSFKPVFSTKAAVIRHIVRSHCLDKKSTLYVGDRDEDAVAAADAMVTFRRVDWGYGGNSVSGEINTKKINDLLVWIIEVL